MGTRVFEETQPLVEGELDVRDDRCIFVVKKSRQRLEFPLISQPYLEAFLRGMTIRQIVEKRVHDGQGVEFSILRKTLRALGEHGAVVNFDQFRAHLTPVRLRESLSVLKISFIRILLNQSTNSLSGFFHLLGLFGASLGSLALIRWWIQSGSFTQMALFCVPAVAIIWSVLIQQIWRWLSVRQTDPLYLNLSLLGPLPEVDARKPFGAFVATAALTALLIPYVVLMNTLNGHVALLQAFTLMAVFLELPTTLSHPQRVPRYWWDVIALGVFFFIARALFALWDFGVAQQPLELIATLFVAIIFVYFGLDLLVFLWQESPKRTETELSSEKRTINFFEGQRRQLIAANPLFQALPPALLQELVQHSNLIGLQRRSYVCRSGDRSTDLYLLLQGKVGVYKRNLFGGPKLIVELKANSIFGESGFFFQKPRDADVITLEDAIICRIKRPPSVGWSQGLDDKAAATFRQRIWAYQALAGSTLFAKLPKDALQLFLNRGRILSLEPAAFAIVEGQVGREFFVNIQGRLVVTIKGQRVRDLKAGDFFGEIALIHQVPRTATVQAAEDALVFKLDEHAFWELLATNLDLACHLEKVALRRILADREREFAGTTTN
jgi:CRP-like cAMP-binding protein